MNPTCKLQGLVCEPDLQPDPTRIVRTRPCKDWCVNPTCNPTLCPPPTTQCHALIVFASLPLFMSRELVQCGFPSLCRVTVAESYSFLYPVAPLQVASEDLPLQVGVDHTTLVGHWLALQVHSRPGMGNAISDNNKCLLIAIALPISITTPYPASPFPLQCPPPPAHRQPSRSLMLQRVESQYTLLD